MKKETRVRLTCVCGESKDLHSPLFGKIVERSEALHLLKEEDEIGYDHDYWAEVCEGAGLFVRLDKEEWMPRDFGRTMIFLRTPHPLVFEEQLNNLEDLFLVEPIIALDDQKRR